MVKRASNFVRDLVRLPQAFQLMIIIAVLVVVGCLAGCATKTAKLATDGSMTITVPKERVTQCKAQGGCGLVSTEELLRFMGEAFDMGRNSRGGGT